MQTKRLLLFFTLLCAFAIISGFWLFNPSQLYFLNDDLIHIPLSKEGVLFQRQSFRPLADLSIRLDYLLYNKNAVGYHLTNLLIHVLNCVVVYFFALAVYKKYFSSKHAYLEAFATAVLFFVYATHSESVLWILGRSGSLATLFFTGAMLCYLKRNQSLAYYFLAILSMVTGLLVYESVWIFPATALIFSVIDFKKFRISVKREMAFVAGVLFVFILYMAARYVVINQVAAPYEAVAFLNFDIKTLLVNGLKLGFRSFLPPFVHSRHFVVACGVFVAIAGLLFYFRYNRRFLFAEQGLATAFLIVLWLLSLAPYLSLGIDTHGLEGERYLYLPSVFCSMLLVRCMGVAAQSEKVRLMLYTVVLGFHLYFLYQASFAFRLASSISKATFEQINLLAGKRFLFVDSLPQAYKGALVFRLGFQEGVQWLKNEGTVDSVYVLTLKKDNRNWHKEYAVKHATIDPNEPVMRGNNLKVGETGPTGALKQPNINPVTDVRFVFYEKWLQVFP